MDDDRRIVLERDCDAVEIPGGDRLRLLAGSEVWLRRRGRTGYTVLTESGILASVAARDADALGELSRDEGHSAGPDSGEFDEQAVWRELRQVYDPEIPVDIVELGLVYGCTFERTTSGVRVDVRMTLTAPGCAVGGLLVEEITQRVSALPGVSAVEVQLVWEPPWSPDRMSEAARVQLGFL